MCILLEHAPGIVEVTIRGTLIVFFINVTNILVGDDASLDAISYGNALILGLLSSMELSVNPTLLSLLLVHAVTCVCTSDFLHANSYVNMFTIVRLSFSILFGMARQ